MKERKDIEKIVVENGGKYSPSLKLTEPNSVLLLQTPEGEKFKFAHIRGVPCLSVKWLYDSVEKGYALPEEDYAIRPMSQSSQSSQSSQNRPKPSNDKQINGKSTTDSIQKEDKRSVDSTSHNISLKSILRTDDSNQKLIDRLNEANKGEETFLENIDIFVVGFDPPVYEVIKSTLISRGSMVFNEFKDLISYVIVGPKCVGSDLEPYFNNKSCKVVSIEWLFECFRRKECCDSSPFELKCPKISQISSSTEPPTKKRKQKHIFDGPLTVVCPKSAHKALAKWKEESKINTKLNHKSLGDRMNDKNDIQWNDCEEEEDIPSQRPYEEANDGSEEI